MKPVDATTGADTQSSVIQPLTDKAGHSGACSNPFCHHGAMAKKPRRKFCCDRCRLDGYVLRRARAMLAEIGVIEFNIILEGAV